MSKTVKLRKGSGYQIVGVANKVKSELVLPKLYRLSRQIFMV